MLRTRVASALVLLPPIVAAIWFGVPYLSLVVAAAAVLGLWELYRLRGLGTRRLPTLFGLAWVLVLVAAAHFGAPFSLLALTSAVVISLVVMMVRSPAPDTAADWAWALAGLMYVGWMLSHFIPLRGLDGGRDWVLFALFATFAADTAAYFIGSALGRHPLAATISPGKTVEGAAGGLLGALAGAFVLAAVLPQLALPWWHVAALGVLIGVFSQAGDLTESLLKRSTGVKDSGDLIPGHGGLLDRLDSIVFTVVVVYYYVVWVIA